MDGRTEAQDDNSKSTQVEAARAKLNKANDIPTQLQGMGELLEMVMEDLGRALHLTSNIGMEVATMTSVLAAVSYLLVEKGIVTEEELTTQSRKFFEDLLKEMTEPAPTGSPKN